MDINICIQLSLNILYAFDVLQSNYRGVDVTIVMWMLLRQRKQNPRYYTYLGFVCNRRHLIQERKATSASGSSD